MTAKFEEISELSFSQVRFFTIRIGNGQLSEFEKFDAEACLAIEHRKELQIIYQTIRQIGMRGAKDSYFRHEGPAFALPGKVSKKIMKDNKADFGLRLYAVIVNFNTVILLNGGIKTHIDPLQCPNVRDHFKRAKQCAIQLTKAINDGLIRFTFESGMSTDDEDFSIDI